MSCQQYPMFVNQGATLTANHQRNQRCRSRSIVSLLDERDYDYNRSRYDSSSDIDGKRDGRWRKRDSCDHLCDNKSFSGERDQCPHRRCEHSQSSGHDNRKRSRSPRVCSRSYSHQDNYDNGRHNRSKGQRDRDDSQSHQQSSMTPTATVVVKGLSKKTTEENIHQFLAEWRPLLHVRVMTKKNSSVCRGFAFLDFPCITAARKMMDVIGECGLDFNGRKLSFEYCIHKSLINTTSADVNDAAEEPTIDWNNVTGETPDDIHFPIVEEFEIGKFQHVPSSDCIFTSISQEDVEELIHCVKKDPYLKPIVEDIEIGGPAVMMRYLSDSEVLHKLGQAMGFGVSAEIDT